MQDNGSGTHEDLSRVLWQCRRGMLELDSVLSQFCKAHYAKLSRDEKTALQQLLQCEDQQLWYWLVNQHDTVPSELKSIVDTIRRAT